MNVNEVLTKDYENKTLSGSGKNKANTKPNKPNLRKPKMNVNKVLTKDYANKTLSGSGKNKANTNPIKANFRKAAMFVTTFQAKGYENISNCTLAENKPNTKPIQTQTNPISKAKNAAAFNEVIAAHGGWTIKSFRRRKYEEGKILDDKWSVMCHHSGLSIWSRG